MPNPPFQPLTMTAERWLQVWSGSAYYELRREVEAQAQEAASLRQRLEESEMAKQKGDPWKKSCAVCGHGKSFHHSKPPHQCMISNCEQACKAFVFDEPADEPDGEYAMDLAVLQDAMNREAAATARASQAEAALEEMQKQLEQIALDLGVDALPQVDSSGFVVARRHDICDRLRALAAELQRRRSAPGQESK